MGIKAQGTRHKVQVGRLFLLCLVPCTLCLVPCTLSLEPCTFSLSLPVMAEARTVAFHTLGCKLNFSETSTLSRMLEKEGFEKKEFTGLADVYVINTCSVTE